MFQRSGLNNRQKMMQNRSNGHVHGHHNTTIWKPDSIRKSSQGHHHHHHHHNQPQLSSSEGSSIAQCTCSRDHQPLLTKSNVRHHHRASHKHESRISQQQQAKRDKAMLIWSTNRDRLIWQWMYLVNWWRERKERGEEKIRKLSLGMSSLVKFWTGKFYEQTIIWHQ